MSSVRGVGVFVPQGWHMELAHIADPAEQYETMTRAAQEAERLGFDSLWLFDHFHTVPWPDLQSNFECWTSTAGPARDTTRIRLGQMVTCNSYRHPAYLAKVASTVDVMSHGRLDFGIGAGWYQHEYEAYGYQYPDAPERLRMLAEAVQVIRAMWTEDTATFEGQYYQVRGAINEPKGVQKPHPPIWIGGGGEKVTLKLVAQYGDASNIPGADPAQTGHKFAVLRQHCEALGRDYDSLIRSAVFDVFLVEPGDVGRLDALTEPFRFGSTLDEFRKRGFVGTPAELIARCQEFIDAGANYFIFYLNDGTNPDQYRLLAAEVLPALRG